MRKCNFVIFIAVIAIMGSFKAMSQSSSQYKEYRRIYAEKINSTDKNDQKQIRFIARWLWENEYLFDENGNYHVPVNNVESALYIPVMEEANTKSWEPLGPVNIPEENNPVSCNSMGRINCIAHHPTNENIMWVGTPYGGIWKTYNAGKTWIPITDNIAIASASDIAVDPKNPNRVYWITGDSDARGPRSQGLLLSDDGGDTWNSSNLIGSKEPKISNKYLNEIIVHPTENNKLIVCGTFGMTRSLDKGLTWEFVYDKNVTDIAIHPNNPDVLFAASLDDKRMIKSTNFGETWTDSFAGIDDNANYGRMEFDISPADPNYMYLVNVDEAGSLVSVYMSTDGGKNWKQTDDKTNILGLLNGDVNDKTSQGWYNLVVFADPYLKDKAHIGSINLWTTVDAGKSWDMSAFWVTAFGKGLHADQHSMSYNPLNQKIYVGNDGGVYSTKEIKQGSKKWLDWIDFEKQQLKPGAPNVEFPTKWTNHSNGLAITQYYRIGLCKNHSGYITGGTQDNACHYFNKSNWSNFISLGDGMETMIDHFDPKIIYGSNQYGRLGRSLDGGKTETLMLTRGIIEKEGNGNWVTPFVMHPQKSKTIYAGFKSLWKSEDAGTNWVNVHSFGLEKPMTGMTISEKNPDRMAVIFRDYKKMYYTSDGGKTWSDLSTTDIFKSTYLTDIVLSEEDDQLMWATNASPNEKIKIFKSTDAGQTWTDYTKGNYYKSVYQLIHQKNSKNNTLYAATQDGIYYTNDDMTEWKVLGKNLPRTRIRDLEIDYNTKELYIASFGRGIWKIDVSENSSVNDFEYIQYDVSIYPNPSKDVFTLEINNITESITSLDIIDMMGRVLFSKKIIPSSGKINEKINHELLSGMYFVRIQIGQQKIVKKIIVK